MNFSNIELGENVIIHETSTINNIKIDDGVRVAKFCSLYGSKDHQLVIGKDTYVGMFSIINGFAGKIVIGKNVSIAQRVNIMADSGPNASLEMQEFFPIIKGGVTIGDHSWIGANVVIMPNVTLGDFCVVAANSYVNTSFSAYSVIGGNPARLIKKINNEDR